ncbi:hypothetical protein [Rhodopirellula sallentina]|uniref:Uncharacterized protein n=1 Tax=Rhodopirellula sallentina SM41 TaxID=1263870 RepID=M5UFS6_9BACT|nr:hypothetical protein [Rhodopirellula sallentina]EMI54858.1 hypothetical protein RSSM_03681 [Rhodopirellula sallentina SM41]
MNCDLDTPIPDWIIEHPETAKVFDRWGLDTSCAGKSLRYVCIHQGLSPQEVFEQLLATTETFAPVDRDCP